MNYLLMITFAFAISYFLTPLVGWIAVKLNILDQPGERKVHVAATPRIGGIAIYVSFLIMFYLAHNMGFFTKGFENEFKGLLIGGLIVFITGLIDDIWGLKPILKLLGQTIAALVLVFNGVSISLFIVNPIVSSVITVLWVVGITNAFNLLDNMDGLSAGVAVIAALMFFVVYSRQGVVDLNILMVILMGSIIGFLRFNLNPARIFMGDAGALFIGFIIAGTSCMGSYLKGSLMTHLPVITPILILSVPIFDTFSVIYIRMRSRISIFAADKRHFSHRLVRLGMTNKQAVLFIYLVSFCVGLGAILLPRIKIVDAFIILIQSLAIFAIIVVLMVFQADELKRKIKNK